MLRTFPGKFLEVSGKFLGHVREVSGFVWVLSGKCPGNIRNIFGTRVVNVRILPGFVSEVSGNVHLTVTLTRVGLCPIPLGPSQTGGKA